MNNFFDLILSGLATGAIYALVAIGFTLVWQTSQTINFAQGEFVMLPAFFVLAVMNIGAPFWLSALIGILLSAIVLGVLFKLAVVDPMLKHGVLPLAIATMALSIGIKEAVKQFYSAEASPFPSLLPNTQISLLGSPVSVQSIGVLAFGIAAVAALNFFLSGTSMGRQMQAAAQNPTVARIVGIPVERMIMLTFHHQRGSGGCRLASGHAHLSRQVLLGRGPRAGCLRRSHRGWLQSGTRCDCRRTGDRRGR